MPGRRDSRAFLGLLASGSNPFGALGLGRLARGAEPGPKVPTWMTTEGFGTRLSHPDPARLFFSILKLVSLKKLNRMGWR